MTSTTHRTGNITEAKVLTALLKHYETVLVPFGDGCIYDLAVDTGDDFKRIQCKSGSLRKGVINFNANARGAYSTAGTYIGKADLFGVYCAANDGTYLVPVVEVPTTSCSLRLQVPRNNQTTGIRWARDYEI